MRAALGLALLGLLARPAWALQPDRALTQYGRDLWQAEQGLPQNTVSAIAQDAAGYLWVGTAEGLVRFDGVRFTVFDRRNTPALPSNVMTALAADPDGALWIGTEAGLVCHRSGRFERLPDWPELGVSALALDRQRHLWVGTPASGAFQVVASRVQPISFGNGRVRAIAETADGAIWAGFDGGGVARLDSATPARLLGDARVSSLAAFPDGTLWVGTYDRGLVQLGADGATLQTVPAARLGSSGAFALHREGNDVLWVGTVGGGVSRLFEGAIDRLTELPDLHIRSLATDAEGSVWIGTLGGGLVRLRDGAFRPWGTSEGIGGESVRLVTEDPRGDIWIGTEQGTVSRLHAGKLAERWVAQVQTDQDGVYALEFEPDGSAWIGTFNGLLRVPAGSRHPVPVPGVSGVHALLRDPDGSMWAGTFRDGLLRLRATPQGLQVQRLTREQGLPTNSVMALCRTTDGTLWLGMASGGVARLDGERVVRVPGLEGAFVYGLLADSDGALWAGTVGQGLARIAAGRASLITSAQGLFDDVVYSIADDGRGALWLTSNRGVFRASRAELIAAAGDRAARVSSTVFGIHDGMRSAECNSGGRASLRDATGKLWFATARGAVVIDPERIPRNTLPPRVSVERMTVDGRQVAPGPELLLAPGGEQFEIQYTTTSLRSPARVRFRYRLDGLDRDWTDAGTRRSAYYNRLPHGSYSFSVSAVNEDGVPSQEPARIEFRVAPRFFETPAFLALSGLLGGLGLLGAHRLRVRHMEHRQAQLEGLIAERTAELRLSETHAHQAREEAVRASHAKSAFLARMSHELRTPLNVILGFVQLLRQDRQRPKQEQEQLDLIARSGEHLLHLINDVLSLAKVEAGRLTLDERDFDLRLLLGDLEQLFRLAARRKGVAVDLEISERTPAQVHGDDGKLRQVLVNLLGNALKFTSAGGIVLRADWTEDRCVLEVEDSGPGIPAAERAHLFEAFGQTESGRQSGEGTGLGLAISQSFLHVMGGSIEYADGRTGGALFRVRLPLSQAGAPPVVSEPLAAELEPGQLPCRLLVVDDHAGNRLVLRSLLERVGFDISEAADGGEAIRLWRLERPALIWMDLRMEPLDGYEATRAIRREEHDRSLPHTPVLALTASSFEHEREQILAAGCDDVLYKPFRAASLWAALQRHLGLRFVAADPAAVEAASEPAALSLSELPPSLRTELLDALERGDVTSASAAVERIDAQSAELAERLRGLLRSYRFEEILSAGGRN